MFRRYVIIPAGEGGVQSSFHSDHKGNNLYMVVIKVRGRY